MFPQLPAPPPRPRPIPYKKLTLVEVQRKKERGECWFCEEKWVRCHKCPHTQLLMLDVLKDELGHDQGDQDASDVPPEMLHMELSECAFYGTPTSRSVQTMKVDGLLRNQLVHILLDSGSTHNILDSRLAKKWGWLLNSTHVFEVMIANEGRI